MYHPPVCFPSVASHRHCPHFVFDLAPDSSYRPFSSRGESRLLPVTTPSATLQISGGVSGRLPYLTSVAGIPHFKHFSSEKVNVATLLRAQKIPESSSTQTFRYSHGHANYIHAKLAARRSRLLRRRSSVLFGIIVALLL